MDYLPDKRHARRLSTSYDPSDVEASFKDAWDKIDTAEERSTLSIDETLADLDSIVKQKLFSSTKKINKQLADRREEVIKRATESKYNVDPSYSGAQIDDSAKIDMTFAQNLLDSFQNGKVLHHKFARRILDEALVLLKSDPAMPSINIPSPGKLVIVGDLHGQLPDLLTVLRLGGLPSVSNSYIFNGDLVDRGPHGPEVLLAVYALKIALPKNVFINRGNHELRRMNEKYDLHDQIFEKYDQEMFELVSETFLYIPFCTCVNNKVFVVHGGTFQYDDVTLDELKALDNERGKDLPRHKGITRRGQLLIENMMWSDPDLSITKWKDSVRGAGIIFGEECVKTFLKNNKLEVVVRSHQMIEAGCEKLFNDTLITVFSASCYAMHNDNQGAILIYNHDTTNWKCPTVVQYYADVLEKDIEGRRESRESETLHKLYERIFESRHSLRIKFEEKDSTEKPGCVDETHWEEVMKNVLELDINWKSLRPYLAKREPDVKTLINYTKFLDRFQISLDKGFMKDWQRDCVTHFCGKFLEHQTDIQDAFNSIDTDGNGFLSYQEFVTAIKGFDMGLTETQLYDFITSIDTDRNGQIDYSEFKTRFGHEFGKAQTHSNWIKTTVNELAKKIVTKHKSIKESFLTFDSDGDHRISYREFSNILKRDLDGEQFSPEHRRELFQYIDENNSGAISYKEFKAAFAIGDTKDNTWENLIIQRVCDAIRKSKVQLKAVFRDMDKDKSGTLDVLEFKAGLEAMNILLEHPMTDMQIHKLHKALDKDGDGTINYDEFLKSFEVKLML